MAITAAPLLPEAALKDAELLVWGDDHCNAVIPTLRALCKKHGITAYGASQSKTAPLLGTHISDYSNPRKHYADFNNAMFEFARRSGVKHVLLVAKWSNYVPTESGYLEASQPTIKPAKSGPQRTFHEGLVRTVKRLHGIGVHVWIMEEVPSVEIPEQESDESTGIPLVTHLSDVHDTARLFSEVAVGLGSADRMINFLDPVLYLSNETGLCPAFMEGRALYRDTGLLSTQGALRLEPMFRPMVGAIISDRD